MSRSTGNARLRLPGWLAVLAGAVPLPTLAQPAVVGATCLEIEDGQERLACFDRAVGAAVRGTMTDGAGSSGTTGPAVLGTGPGAATTLPATAPTSEPTRLTATTSRPTRSLIDTAWGVLPDSKAAYVRLHRPNYLLLGRYTTDANTAPYQPLFDAFDEDGEFGNVEAKFQLSVKGRLAVSEDRRWGLWFAYTQQNQWQVYESDISRPFRETNYEPELFGSFHPDLDLGGWRLNLVNFGYNHQSNGRSDPISRSWDRLFVEAGIERGNLVVFGRVWTRIELDDAEDDNPDIVDYYGNAEINALYKWRGNTFTLMGRGNPATGKGAAQFTWSTKPLIGPLRGYLQLFTGYGESMIDYDWNQTTIGVGITLNERF